MAYSLSFTLWSHPIYLDIICAQKNNNNIVCMCRPVPFIVKWAFMHEINRKLKRLSKSHSSQSVIIKKMNPIVQCFIFIHIPYFSLFAFCGAALAYTYIYREERLQVRFMTRKKNIFSPALKCCAQRRVCVCVYILYQKRTEYTAEFWKLCNHLLLLLLHMMMIISMSESPCCFYPNILP